MAEDGHAQLGQIDEAETIEVPVVEITDDLASYEELKVKLLERIISMRMVKEEQLNQFFEEAKKVNEVDDDKYDEIILQIKTEIGYAEGGA